MRLMYRMLNIFGVTMAFGGIVYAFCTFLQLSGWRIAAVYLLGLLGLACLVMAWLVKDRISRNLYLAGIWSGILILGADLVFAFLVADYDNRGLNKANLMGSVLLIATGVFCWFVAIMLKAGPALEYMTEHSEAKIDRDADFTATKDTLALPPRRRACTSPDPASGLR